MVAVHGNLLVVDDDVDSAELLRVLLRKRGYEVTACHNATEALDRLRQEDFDVVVADIQMEGISGIELCARIREMHPDVLTILITGHKRCAQSTIAARNAM